MHTTGITSSDNGTQGIHCCARHISVSLVWEKDREPQASTPAFTRVILWPSLKHAYGSVASRKKRNVVLYYDSVHTAAYVPSDVIIIITMQYYHVHTLLILLIPRAFWRGDFSEKLLHILNNGFPVSCNCDYIRPIFSPFDQIGIDGGRSSHMSGQHTTKRQCACAAEYKKAKKRVHVYETNYLRSCFLSIVTYINYGRAILFIYYPCHVSN